MIVEPSHGSVQWAPWLYICSRGTSAICNGIASSATVAMNSPWRPLKSIHANPYAAHAAMPMGMIVAGIAMAIELARPLRMPPDTPDSSTWR